METDEASLVPCSGGALYVMTTTQEEVRTISITPTVGTSKVGGLGRGVVDVQNVRIHCRISPLCQATGGLSGADGVLQVSFNKGLPTCRDTWKIAPGGPQLVKGLKDVQYSVVDLDELCDRPDGHAGVLHLHSPVE